MALGAALVDNARVLGRVGQGVFLPVPTGVTAKTSQNGTLPAGGYVYAVTALAANGGETTVSATVAPVLALDGGCRVSWEVVVGAVSYRVYRGPDAPSLALLAEVAAKTFYDDGAMDADGPAPPTANSALGNASGSPAFSTVTEDWFRCRLQLPAAPETADPTGRRRTTTVPTLMYALRDSAGVDIRLSPEVRVEVESPAQLPDRELFDVVSMPEPMRKKRTVIGWTVTLRRVEPGQAERAA